MTLAGRLPTPRVDVDLAKLRHNAATVAEWCRRAGLEVFAVTKGVRGDLAIARVLIEAGVSGLADSRLSNLGGLRALRDGESRSDRRPSYLLLRPPPPALAAEAVAVSDAVLCTDEDVGAALAAACAPGRSYDILLPVDLGDLREGVLPAEVRQAAVRLDEGLAAAAGRRDPDGRARVAGLAANMACFCGVVPARSHLELLGSLAREAEAALGRRLRVSGGNTAVLPLLLKGEVPAGLDDLRVGEGILLGRESLHRNPLPGCHLDAFTFWAPVLEVGRKPSFPVGELAEDAFGQRQVFVDRGPRLRAVLAAGRQDVVPEGLKPLAAGIEVVGATSDHLVVDVEEYPGRVRAGVELGFGLNYACLLQAMTSPDVARVYVGDA